MRTMRWQSLLALPILALAACKDAPPARSPRATVMIFAPKVPGSLVVDTTGSEEAERLTMVVPVSADSVARYYRATLARAGWVLLSDRTVSDFIDLYAGQGPTGNSSLWVHIERQDTLSTRYTLIIGTPADSDAVRGGGDSTSGAQPN